MNKDSVKRNVTISVSNNELEALEDSLIAWNLCKKHKAQVWTLQTGQKSEQQIFKMQDECKACQRYNKRVQRQAWKVLSKLFTAWDKTTKTRG